VRRRPDLDADLAAALEVLERGLGPVQVLDVGPTPPQRRPAPPPAPAAAGPDQPSLFDSAPEPPPPATSSTTDPLSHVPPSWREVLRVAGDPRPTVPLPTPDTRRRTA
jgi:hypothetical protein